MKKSTLLTFILSLFLIPALAQTVDTIDISGNNNYLTAALRVVKGRVLVMNDCKATTCVQASTSKMGRK